MSCLAMSDPVELFDRLDDIRELLLRQMLVRRKRNHARGVAVGHREVAPAVPEVGEGPPAVLLHGLFGQARNFATLQRRLAEGGNRVIALDLKGFGFTGKPAGDYTRRAVTRRLGTGNANGRVFKLSISAAVAKAIQSLSADVEKLAA